MLKRDFLVAAQSVCSKYLQSNYSILSVKIFEVDCLLGGSSQFKLKSVRYLKATIRAELPGLRKSREYQLELIQ